MIQLKCVTRFSKTMKNKQETLKDFHKINTRFLTLSELKISKTKSIYMTLIGIFFTFDLVYIFSHFIWPSWSICTCHVTTHPSCPILFVLSYSTLVLILMVVYETMTTVRANGKFSYFLSNSERKKKSNCHLLTMYATRNQDWVLWHSDSMAFLQIYFIWVYECNMNAVGFQVINTITKLIYGMTDCWNIYIFLNVLTHAINQGSADN